MTISETLLEILVCPTCKQKLELTPQNDALLCRTCRLRYPVEDGIPVLIPSEAKPID